MPKTQRQSHLDSHSPEKTRQISISTGQKMIRSFHFLGSSGVSPLHKWIKPLPISFSSTLPKSRRVAPPPAEFFSPSEKSQSIRYFRSFQMSSSRSEYDQDETSAVPTTLAPKPKIRFCQSCGGPTKQDIPDGEEKTRAVCTLCGQIFYENPKMVVGCLVEHDNKVLLCKRNIEPSYGLWTLPAGFLEIGESAAEGATRETLEEACAEVEVISPFAQLDIPLIAQYRVTFFSELN